MTAQLTMTEVVRHINSSLEEPGVAMAKLHVERTTDTSLVEEIARMAQNAMARHLRVEFNEYEAEEILGTGPASYAIARAVLAHPRLAALSGGQVPPLRVNEKDQGSDRCHICGRGNHGFYYCTEIGCRMGRPATEEERAKYFAQVSPTRHEAAAPEPFLSGGQVEAKCYECEADLVGPFCPKCNQGLVVGGPRVVPRQPFVIDDDIAAAPEPPASAEWQPIETAPDDEECFFWLDWAKDCAPLNQRPPLTNLRLIRCRKGGWSSVYRATHWMPLPAPPSQPDGERP